MRPIRNIVLIATLLLPGCVFGASREQQEMQRDIAQLQSQVQALQSAFDQKISALQTLTQQAVDAANKANTNVSVLTAGVNQTLDRELKQSLAPITGLGVKVDNTNNDVAEIRNSVEDLNKQVNKILSLLNDVNAQVKVMQAPAPPPPSGSNVSGPTSNAGGPPPAASAIFDNAVRDQNGGKTDLALSEYADFLKFYPDDPNAANAQFYIGEIHYAQTKLDLAVQDFDAVIERYGENSKLVPDAYFMKGMSLKQSSHRDAAGATFRALIAKFPRSEKAAQAKDQLTAMGVSASPPAATTRRRAH